MIAMGFVGDIGELGLEGSGIVRRVGSNVANIMPGDEILILDSGLMRTRIIVNQQHCLKLPKGLSTVDAVNMASVFATAIYSLINVGQLKKSEVCNNTHGLFAVSLLLDRLF